MFESAGVVNDALRLRWRVWWCAGGGYGPDGIDGWVWSLVVADGRWSGAESGAERDAAVLERFGGE